MQDVSWFIEKAKFWGLGVVITSDGVVPCCVDMKWDENRKLSHFVSWDKRFKASFFWKNYISIESSTRAKHEYVIFNFRLPFYREIVPVKVKIHFSKVRIESYVRKSCENIVEDNLVSIPFRKGDVEQKPY